MAPPPAPSPRAIPKLAGHPFDTTLADRAPLARLRTNRRKCHPPHAPLDASRVTGVVAPVFSRHHSALQPSLIHSPLLLLASTSRWAS